MKALRACGRGLVICLALVVLLPVSIPGLILLVGGDDRVLCWLERATDPIEAWLDRVIPVRDC